MSISNMGERWTRKAVEELLKDVNEATGEFWTLGKQPQYYTLTDQTGNGKEGEEYQSRHTVFFRGKLSECGGFLLGALKGVRAVKGEE